MYYAGEPCDHKYWTLQDALQQYASKVAAVPGLSSVTSSDTKDFPAAAAAAASADAVVFALGNDLLSPKATIAWRLRCTRPTPSSSVFL
jgi:hypothetical protein